MVHIQAIDMCENKPSTFSKAPNTPNSINNSAINTLKNSQITRPGWLWVKREKKLDHAKEPAYALVTLILIWLSITNKVVAVRAHCGLSNSSL